ncbi:MAG: hypothetical protein D3M94_09205 [Rhodocyclales bacterium GT-UBC]|nr:MAG: hypothetical protein D3M94_09205 [Rhodocyclales bacterium GT-UBC]
MTKVRKSCKQRRAEIRAARLARRQLAGAARRVAALRPTGRIVLVDYSKLAIDNSYGMSDFALRGYYVDQAFTCCDCGAAEIWTAERQRWWYETAGGGQYTRAKRCAACRARERQRKEQARQTSLAGRLRKLAWLAETACGR